jgi:hypothetical protein
MCRELQKVCPVRIAYVTDDKGCPPYGLPRHDEATLCYLRWVGHRAQALLPYAALRGSPLKRDAWRCQTRWPWWVALHLRRHWRQWAPDVICISHTAGHWGEQAARSAAAAAVPVFAARAGMTGPVLEQQLQLVVERHRAARVAASRALWSQRT